MWILHGANDKFFGTFISFFRTFKSFFRSFISFFRKNSCFLVSYLETAPWKSEFISTKYQLQ